MMIIIIIIITTTTVVVVVVVAVVVVVVVETMKLHAALDVKLCDMSTREYIHPLSFACFVISLAILNH
jgi:hypothetical protein